MKNSKKKGMLKYILLAEGAILLIVIAVFVIKSFSGNESKDGDAKVVSEQEETETTPEPTLSPEELERLRIEEEKKLRAEMIDSAIAQADGLAAMYDYDGAIELLESIDDYNKETKVTAKITEYNTSKAACVVWEDNTKISHLFVHSLIVDTERAFAKTSSQPVGYNRYMTTVDEFRKMLQQMYDKGYVLISIHRIAAWEKQEDGTEKLVPQEILLPQGKIPFVLSQDDVNYYAYMDGDGFASRLVVGEDGLPTCEYIDKDGNVLYGEYDVLPIVDAFIREHPDFSYRGDKGILAVTGYEGALGYDTGWHMHDLETEEGKKALEEQQKAATEVADAIKADGWEFASHSYTHTNMTNNSIDKVIYDTDKWEAQVEPILGETDIMIYPFGADICDWRGYSGDKYEYLKKAGFTYFCNVDSAQYWIQIHDEYMRMGRINADGERLYHTPEKLTYFFDPATVFDPSRPTPVNPDWKN